MTRSLVSVLAPLRGGPLIAGALVVGALLPAAALLDGVRLLLRWHRRHRVLAATMASCPAQHQVTLVGGWQCESCKAGFDGHGFDRCPSCGAVAARLACACGRYVASPLYADEDAP